jgi:hypothetical protein
MSHCACRRRCSTRPDDFRKPGVALNQFIDVAVAEKLSALRTEDYIRLRSGRADVPRAKRILARAGKGKPPVPGDEIHG